MCLVRCDKCGDESESDSDPNLLCGRNFQEELNLNGPLCCDGIYRETPIDFDSIKSEVLEEGELRTKVMRVASDMYGEPGEVEIDQDARVTEVSGECYWVIAHLWVPVDSVE